MTLETNFQSAGHLFKKSSLNGQSLLYKVEKVKKTIPHTVRPHILNLE